jgi:hypothetical protein
VQKLYGGREPEIKKEAMKYKPMFTVELPYEVEKKFFKTGPGGLLIEIPAPLLQQHTTSACFSFWLKKKHVTEKKADGKEVEGVGTEAVELLKKLEALNMEGSTRKLIVDLFDLLLPQRLIVIVHSSKKYLPLPPRVKMVGFTLMIWKRMTMTSLMNPILTKQMSLLNLLKRRGRMLLLRPHNKMQTVTREQQWWICWWKM